MLLGRQLEPVQSQPRNRIRSPGFQLVVFVVHTSELLGSDYDEKKDDYYKGYITMGMHCSD